ADVIRDAGHPANRVLARTLDVDIRPLVTERQVRSVEHHLAGAGQAPPVIVDLAALEPELDGQQIAGASALGKRSRDDDGRMAAGGAIALVHDEAVFARRNDADARLLLDVARVTRGVAHPFAGDEEEGGDQTGSEHRKSPWPIRTTNVR